MECIHTNIFKTLRNDCKWNGSRRSINISKHLMSETIWITIILHHTIKLHWNYPYQFPHQAALTHTAREQKSLRPNECEPLGLSTSIKRLRIRFNELFQHAISKKIKIKLKKDCFMNLEICKRLFRNRKLEDFW